MPGAPPCNFISQGHALDFYGSSLLPLFWILFSVGLFLYTCDPVLSGISHSFSLLMVLFDTFQCTKLFKSTPFSSHAKKILIGGEGRCHNTYNFVSLHGGQKKSKMLWMLRDHIVKVSYREWYIQSAVKQVSPSRKRSAKNNKFHGSYTGILLWYKILRNFWF